MASVDLNFDQVPKRQDNLSFGPATEYKGSILPFSVDRQGNKHLDFSAGIPGAVWDALTLPRDVMSGKVNPTSDEGVRRATNMAAMTALDSAAPGVATTAKQARVKPPSTEALYSAGSDAFNRMRDSGVDYASSAVKDFAQQMKAKLESNGFDPEVASKTHRILDKLSSPPENSVASIANLHSARKTFGKIAGNFNDPTDQSAAKQALGGMDEFVANPPEAGVVAGTASAAARALQEGNANYAAAKRSDQLRGIEENANFRAAAANSGTNIGNSIRRRIASILENPKKAAGYSPEERVALERVVKGTIPANATRRIGNLFGGGGGLGQFISMGGGGLAGGAMGGATGATAGAMAIPAIGMASKAASNMLTERALKVADALTRSRSPLYQEMKATAPMIESDPAKKAAIVRALLLQKQEKKKNHERPKGQYLQNLL